MESTAGSDELTWGSLASLRELTSRGAVSSVELADHFLARIARLDRHLGSFVTVVEEVSRSQAAACDELLRNGSELPLGGVPTAAKDLTLTKDFPTRYGSLLFRDARPPTFDADVITAIKQGGGVLLGKTAVSEFGSSLSCETKGFPVTRNPWALEESAGGSSGGAAAAVAAGLVPWAQGSDGGGSNRVPAALCGVFGYKPSRGMVSHGPLHSGMFGLPVNGPIARSVDDVLLALSAMSIEFLGEPYLRPTLAYDSSWLESLRDGGPMRRPDGTPIRVGRHCVPMFAEVEVDPDVRDGWERCSRALADLGCEVVDVNAPFDPSIGDAFNRLLAINMANPVRPEQEELLMPLTRYLRDSAAGASATDLIVVLGQIQNACRRAMRGAADVDIILTPTLSRSRLPLGWLFESGDPADQIVREREVSPFCPGYTLTGQPALAAPMWGQDSSRPVSVMLGGRQAEDDLLLAIAGRLEREGVFEVRRPPLER